MPSLNRRCECLDCLCSASTRVDETKCLPCLKGAHTAAIPDGWPENSDDFRPRRRRFDAWLRNVVAEIEKGAK